MNGWRQSRRIGFYDLPAANHNRACGFSFADGHSEIKKWQDDLTMPPLVNEGLITDQFFLANNPDVLWIQEPQRSFISPFFT